MSLFLFLLHSFSDQRLKHHFSYVRCWFKKKKVTLDVGIPHKICKYATEVSCNCSDIRRYLLLPKQNEINPTSVHPWQLVSCFQLSTILCCVPFRTCWRHNFNSTSRLTTKVEEMILLEINNIIFLNFAVLSVMYLFPDDSSKYFKKWTC